jgi:transposase
VKKKAKEKRDVLSLEITQQSLDLLSVSIKSSNLAPDDQDVILLILDAFLKIRILVMTGKARLKSLLAKIYGLKTERRKGGGSQSGSAKKAEGSGHAPDDRNQSSPEPSPTTGHEDSPTKATDSKKTTPRKGGQGRNGRNDFPGATKICVNHQAFKAGDVCPDCGKGKLVEQTPKSALRFFGQPPIKLDIYLLQKLVCSLCSSIFSPAVPGELEMPKEPTGDPETKHKERVYDPTVAAGLVCQRFQLGVPHNRLEEVLNAEGLPFPASTQIKAMEPLKEPGALIFNQLELQSAGATQIYIDDTHKRVLEMERAKQPEDFPEKESKPDLLRPKAKKKKKPLKKRGTATAIVAETEIGKISIFYTGYQVAGMNLADLLKLRDSRLGPPLVMCDGLAANKPKGHNITSLNCLDHARRKFYDLILIDDNISPRILDLFGVVYKNDKEAKDKKLSPEERLKHHQTHSGPAMDTLYKLVDEIMEGKHSEPNSLLVGAAEYIFKRKVQLTQFLRLPGVPISNAEAERLIKTYIRHRKNSLQFFSLEGAKFGSHMMSIIQTCRNFGVSAFEYLTAIARYAVHVKEAPSLWMPWNFRDRIPDSC